MPAAKTTSLPLAFDTFGDLLKYLRRRAQLTQRELSIAVGYSEAQISRLEQDQRLPDLATIAALFIPALDLADEPHLIGKLIELAARARGETLTLTHTVTHEITEMAKEEAFVHHLLLPLTNFIGRQEEVETATRLLAEARLVTLTGAGGVGKTRLALEVVARQTHVVIVDLAPLSNAAHLPQAVATALGLRFMGDRSVLEAVVHFLQARHLWVVLDNCEHVLSATAHLVETLLRACPQVRILATSREALQVAGETVYRVPPLVEQDAQKLFLARARNADAGFMLTAEAEPLVKQICQRLDGLPLAIELAAAGGATVSLAEIVARLDAMLDTFITHNRTAPARQKTLRATIEWSHQLLTEDERVLLRRLAVFAGSFDASAVERINLGAKERESTLTGLTRLVTKSLVVANTSGPNTRYHLLETIRQYAAEKLADAGETEMLQRAHFNYFAELAATSESKLKGPENWVTFRRLEAEDANLQAALAWALENAAYAGLQMLLAMWHFWRVRGYVERGQWLSNFLAQPSLPERTPSVALAQVLHAVNTLSPTEAAPIFSASRALCVEASDRAASAFIFIIEGNAWWWHDYARARTCFEESLALYHALLDDWGAAQAHLELGELIQTRGEDRAAARQHFELSAELFRYSGDRQRLAAAIVHLGDVALEQSDLPTAEACSHETLAIAREFGDKETQSWALNDLGIVAFGRGDFERAIELHTASLRLSEAIGNTMHIGIRQYWLGLAYTYAGQLVPARACLEANLALNQAERAEWGIAASLYGLGEIARRQGHTLPAQTYFLDALAGFEAIHYGLGLCLVLDGLAAIAAEQNQCERAAQIFGAAGGLRTTIGVILLPIERVERERQFRIIRLALGAETFEAKVNMGQALGWQEALSLARQ